MILGLDVSTSCIGYCVKEEDEIKKMHYIKFSPKKSLMEKAAEFENFLKILLVEQMPIETIYIEEPFLGFGKGMSSAKTITTLYSFNGIVQFICYKLTGKDAHLVNVNRARKALGIKTVAVKKCGIPVKEQVFNWVHNKLLYPWPKKVLKSGPRKGCEIVINEARDMSDAWVIASAGQILIQK
tara:strand:+ start:308 stop:856 length:549 start_codon:yes stop_codon:yes gene_type:complete